MSDDAEFQLRAAMRAWLDACDRLDAALTGDEYASVVELADTATLARLQLRQTLIGQGWRAPAETPRTAGNATDPASGRPV